MNLTEALIRTGLGNYAALIPKVKGRLEFRDDAAGIAVFDRSSLITVIVDKNAAHLLKSINGGSNLCKLTFELAAWTGLHPVMLFYRVLQYVSNFQQLGFISLPVEIKSHRPVAGKTHRFSSPALVSWEITKACNLKCSHCASRIMEGRELDTPQALGLIEHLSGLGVFMLSFSGGEPFMRSDFFLLLDLAHKLGIETGITTNGTLLDEEKVKQLKSVEPFNVHISLDGIGVVHDSFRNKTGVFDAAVTSLKLLRQYGIPHGITTSVTRRNFNDLDNIREFVKLNGISSWEIFFAIPVGNLEKHEALTEAGFIELADKVECIRKDLKNTKVFVGDSLGYFGSACIRDKEWAGCTAGINHCAIDAYGNVRGCPIQPDELIEGNIRDKRLDEIWNSDTTFLYNRSDLKLQGYCSKCRHRKVCRGGCRTSAYYVRGNIGENRMCLHYLEKGYMKKNLY